MRSDRKGSRPGAAHFITFEGGEGSGKSTQAARLKARLARTKKEVVLTREPGGTACGEAMRTFLLRKKDEPLSALTQTLLFSAARNDHLEKIIEPALRRGAWVISDRFSDSTRAYQGAALGLELKIIETFDEIVIGQTYPALTFILDMAAEKGLSRADQRRLEEGGPKADRFESEELPFHQKLRQAFLQIALLEPKRCHIIDAEKSEEVVAEEIWAIVTGRFDELKKGP